MNSTSSPIRSIANGILIYLIFHPISFFGQSLEYKEFDNIRFEGQQGILYGAPDFELVSFLGFREDFSEDKSYNLKIGFYFSYELSDSLHITAQELQRNRKFYFMRPKKKNWEKGRWHEFSQWPSNDVLEPLRIRINQIGIVGRLNVLKESSCDLVPLHFFHEELPDSINKYKLHYRSRSNLRGLLFSLKQKATNRIVWSAELHDISGGETYSIKLDFSGLKAGYYLLEVEGKLADNPEVGPRRKYTFFHQPKID